MVYDYCIVNVADYMIMPIWLHYDYIIALWSHECIITITTTIAIIIIITITWIHYGHIATSSWIKKKIQFEYKVITKKDFISITSG